VDYADLPILDFSKLTNPEAHAELAIQARDAMTAHGFFYVVNHGYTPAQVSGFP
jgi:isopenicillin N synthase-like dioxygenase